MLVAQIDGGLLLEDRWSILARDSGMSRKSPQFAGFLLFMISLLLTGRRSF
jgi:hypothetical protein